MAKNTREPNTGTAQSRLCFVIMPFSGTDSCTADQWTSIFETLLKPAVENADLNYVCRRSAATRGSIVRAIMESLRDAYVVVADLTDQKPNVFYELGVRHALKNRTILVAQDERFIPSDLMPYAYHIYDWRTEEGKRELASRLRELLADVDQSPERPDNPVSDYLKGQPGPPPLTEPAITAPQGAPPAQALAGPESKSVDPLALGLKIAGDRYPISLRAIVRPTRAFFRHEWPLRIEQLNREPTKATSIRSDEVYAYCLPYVDKFARDIQPLEAFGLALIEGEYSEGIVEILRIVEDWITISDKIPPGRSLEAIRGAPGLLALRILATWGAKAVECMSLDILAALLARPLETVEAGGQPTSLCLVDRRDMFHPNALLDRADLAVRYLQEEPLKNRHVAALFPGRQEYLDGLSSFLFLAALLHEARHPDESWPLYPGFKLVEGSLRSIHTFVGRISTQPQLMGSLARMANEDIETFRSNWPKRARRLNDAQLGRPYFRPSRDIPEEI